MEEDYEKEIKRLEKGDLVVISDSLDLPYPYKEGVISDILEIKNDKILIMDNEGNYRRIWKIEEAIFKNED